MNNVYVKVIFVIVSSHFIRCAAEYAYFTQCAGLWNSIFSWNSPMCRGLRWTADSTMTNVAAMIGGYAAQGIKLLT
jgi:hypothetical protein